jgi:hypothetical protein
VLVDDEGRIIGGHGRVEAAKREGQTDSGHCRFELDRNCKMTGYGTFQFRETAASSHLRTTAASFDRAGVTYLTRWTFWPAGYKKRHGSPLS